MYLYVNIRLSGHYDILYKAEDVPSPIHHQAVPAQAPLQVNFTNYADEFLPQASNFDVMSMLPGMGRPSLGGWASLSYDCNPIAASQPQVTPVQPFPSASMSAPPITSSLDFVTPIPNTRRLHQSASKELPPWLLKEVGHSGPRCTNWSLVLASRIKRNPSKHPFSASRYPINHIMNLN